MKKKILSLVLAMTLVLAYAVPAAAAETDAQTTETLAAEDVVTEETTVPAAAEKLVPQAVDSNDMASEDPAVQKAYDAYKALENALAAGDIAALEEAADYLETLEFETDAQQDEFDALIEEKVGTDKYLVTAFSAAYVINAKDKYETYKADKNAATAYDFVVAVDTVTEDYELSMELFVPGISADYEAAKANYLPDEDVVAVYEAYVDVVYCLEFGYYDSDFIEVCNAFESVLDIFNELTEEQLEELAVLMGVSDGEAAWSQIFSDWINANLILQVGELDADFTNNPSEETAAAFVEAYENILNDTEVLSDADKQLILYGFGFNDGYDNAKALLSEGSESAGEPSADEPSAEEESTAGVTDNQTTGTTESDLTEEPSAEAETSDEQTTETAAKDAAVETGDDFNIIPYAVLMMMAAVVAGLAVKRRKVQ